MSKRLVQGIRGIKLLPIEKADGKEIPNGREYYLELRKAYREKPMTVRTFY